MNLGIDFAAKPLLVILMNSCSSSLLKISDIGAVMCRLLDGIRCLIPSFLQITRWGPLSEAIRFIFIPRNLAWSDLALVISVFSRDNSNSSFFRKDLTWVFSVWASFFEPQIPTIQSSAYLTYLKRMISGLCILDLSLPLSVIRHFSLVCSDLYESFV